MLLLHFLDTLFGLHFLDKIIDRLSDVTYELFSQDGSTLHVHRNQFLP